MEESGIRLTGTVEHVMFFNKNNGYIVLDLNTGEALVTVVGELGEIEDGETLILEGNYTSHVKFGVQFRAEYCERKLPSTTANIQKYLASGAIHGIGPSLAKKIVEEFGEQTLEIMEHDPSQLSRLKGISEKKCDEIAKEVKQIFNLRSLMIYLSQYDIRASYAMRSFQHWGANSRDVIEQNPYRLCDSTIGLEFEKAERLASAMQISKASHQRIIAGMVYLLHENALEGHTCLPLDRFSKLACRYLDIGERDFYAAYQEAKDEQILCEYVKGEREFVYLADYYTAESYISQRVAVIQAFSAPENFDFEALIDIEEEQNGIHYEARQREAITTALSRGIMILTGGPGTGKTTTLNAIISLYEKQGSVVMLAAPTGRAAKRISDLTGYDAKTIHRLLEVEFDMGGQLKFKHNETNPLLGDVLIVDEMSMVDVLLFESLLRALKLSCRVVLVGDSDQLPSVGAGNLLGDLIESECVPVIALKEIFRQAQQSCIVTNAHKIVGGLAPDLTRKDSDCFFMQRLQTDAASELIVSLCRDRLPKAYHYSPIDDIQVIAPARKGVLGVIALNQLLQTAINPEKKGAPQVKSALYTFRTGDKVMQTKNNYDIEWHKDDEPGTGIFNGDIGRILSIDRQQYLVKIDFDGRITSYPFELIDQLELAYAITVHKSQGSEFEAVVLPILGGFERLYYRNLLYTAVTRAKHLLILVGSQSKIMEMVNNNRRTNRYSCLRAMLREA